MARISAAQMRRGGMVAVGGYPRSLFNLHNQAVPRAQYQGPQGVGFTIEFHGHLARQQIETALSRGVVVIRASAGEALVETTDTIKQQMRAFLDAHFVGSEMHGNNHRRVANAASQSVYYDDVSAQGQLAALIYSKFGIGKGGGFVDFLLLHMRGGTLRPKTGKYLMIPNEKEVVRGWRGANIGSFRRFDIGMARSKDGQKLYLIERRGTQTRLLATLLKSLRVEPRLQGLEAILAQGGALFESNFSGVISRRAAEAGL